MKYFNKKPLTWFYLSLASFLLFQGYTKIDSILYKQEIIDLPFVFQESFLLLVLILSILSFVNNKSWLIKAISMLLMALSGIPLFIHVTACIAFYPYCNLYSLF
jgi:hypothetical protein